MHVTAHGTACLFVMYSTHTAFNFAVYSRLSVRGFSGLQIIRARSKSIMINDIAGKYRHLAPRSN